MIDSLSFALILTNMNQAAFRESGVEFIAQVGNIVEAGTAAVVNAANSRLAGGGGVDGAIHRAAGSDELRKLTAPIGGCPTGSAVITGAARMAPPTRHIIHAVGPVYSSLTDARCAAQLASTYRRCMELAKENRIESIAFPSISTGAYGYPIELAAPIAVQTVRDTVREVRPAELKLVKFVLFSESDFLVYEKIFREFANAAK